MAKWSYYTLPTGDLLREVWVPERLTIRELAHLLGLKPFKVVACLMLDLKMFKSMDDTLDFEVAAKIALQFGFKAKQMPL